MLELTAITKAFDGTPVLHGVDLSVVVGGSRALLGPSGSGKSTLLRIAAGLETPDTGTVRLSGNDVTNVPPHRRGIGFMFQQHALFPHRTVGGNVAFGLQMLGESKSAVRDQVRAALDLVGLAALADRRVDRLSGGEQQRVALARALAPRPRVLLLDEPFGSLDRARRDALVVEVRELLHRLEVTFVAVTHDAEEAAALAPDISVLDGGVIVQSGSLTELAANPVSDAVRGVLGRSHGVGGPPTG